MSLINDALKTAQRERSGQVQSGSGGQPLLDGFFPYTSTGSPKGQANRARVALIAGAGLVVFGVGLWFAVPMVRAALRSAPKQTQGIGPSPQQSGPAPTVTPVAPPEQVAAAAAETTSVDSTQARTPAENPTVDRQVQHKSRGRPTVTAADPGAVRREAIAQPSEPLSGPPDRGGSVSVEAGRPNLEAEAVAAFNTGDYQTARVRFEAALRAIPTASGWTNYGVTLEKLGDQRGAAAAYQKAMGVDPSYLNAWLYLARIYSAGGDVQRAVPLFNRALEIEPTNSDVNADLAELEFKMGAFPEARRYAGVAARSNPSNPRAHYYLALSADTLKDRDLARRGYEDFLRTIAGQERENSASVGYARVRLQELKGKP
ncbi:MAG TPA: tetratricopeptide repeat protein [Gemmatimonadaceae bacterium]|jgi:Tfp pilus assembly protein PilF